MGSRQGLEGEPEWGCSQGDPALSPQWLTKGYGIRPACRTSAVLGETPAAPRGLWGPGLCQRGLAGRRGRAAPGTDSTKSLFLGQLGPLTTLSKALSGSLCVALWDHSICLGFLAGHPVQPLQTPTLKSRGWEVLVLAPASHPPLPSDDSSPLCPSLAPLPALRG